MPAKSPLANMLTVFGLLLAAIFIVLGVGALLDAWLGISIMESSLPARVVHKVFLLGAGAWLYRLFNRLVGR